MKTLQFFRRQSGSRELISTSLKTFYIRVPLMGAQYFHLEREMMGLPSPKSREGSNPGSIRHFTWKELRQRVAKMAQAMCARGVKKGDRVSVVASNSVDTITVFLGVTALGGLFSSSSTDMGVRGILDRLQQIKPKYLFLDDWAFYNGKKVDLRPKMVEVVEGMNGHFRVQGYYLTASLASIACRHLTSTQLQYTTTGWIMYLLAVQVLITGARAVLYDGSPFVPKPESFLKLIEDQKITYLGVSPRYFSTLQQNEIVPQKVADLRHLKVITSTGMVLPDALFEWFYETAFPPSVRLDNIAGGTDVAGAFGTGNPILPVYVGAANLFLLACLFR
jgi:acyl-coenzyme A synthetase/AMP-(fatty) acid ligase